MYKTIGFLSVFLAVVVPYFKLPVIGIPFHISLPLLLFGGAVYLKEVGLSWAYLIFVLVLLILSAGSALYSAVLNFEFSVFSWAYKLTPLACLALSFLICWYSNFTDTGFRKFIFLTIFGFVAISVFQFVPSLKNIFVEFGYISVERSEVWNRYYMLIAPMNNPNNSSAVAAALALFCILSWKVIKRKNYFFLGFIIVFFPILIFLMFLGYARTVSAAFAVAVMLWVIVKGRFASRFLLCVSFLVLVLVGVYFQSRELSYYLTILSALSDSSFIARFDYWLAVFRVMNEYPLSWVFGLARLQDALVEMTGRTVVDSSYIFILGQFGLLVLLGLLTLVSVLSLKSFRFFVFCTFLAICSISLAILSDVRLSIIFGGLAGYIYSISRPPVRKVKSENE